MFFLHHYRHNFGWHHHKYLGSVRQAQGAFDMLRDQKDQRTVRKKSTWSLSLSKGRCFYKNLCVATVYFTGGFAA